MKRVKPENQKNLTGKKLDKLTFERGYMAADWITKYMVELKGELLLKTYHLQGLLNCQCHIEHNA